MSNKKFVVCPFSTLALMTGEPSLKTNIPDCAITNLPKKMTGIKNSYTPVYEHDINVNWDERPAEISSILLSVNGENHTEGQNF